MLKYSVIDETGTVDYLKTDSLKEATDKAKSMHFSSFRQCGIRECFKVVNTRIGTLAFVIE